MPTEELGLSLTGLTQYEKLQRETGLTGQALRDEWLRRQERHEPPMFDQRARLSGRTGWLPLHPHWVMKK